MAARRNRKRRRRNRGRFGALYKLLSILLIFAAILAGCIIFFRVNTMVVTGNSRYTQEEILAAAGVEKGDNLFTLNKYQIADRILTQLPYVDDVAISRKLPDTLIFEVSESAGVAWVESGGSYWLLDDKCKLLEVGDAALVQGKPQVLGLDPVNSSVGNLLTVSAEQQDKLEQLQAFLKAIRERLMTGSLKGFIDLTSANEIRFGYGENLTVIFPMNGDFTQETYELKLALETMDERGLPRTGTLDQNYEDNKIHLLPERWLPEGWSPLQVTTEPTQQPEASGGEARFDAFLRTYLSFAWSHPTFYEVMALKKIPMQADYAGTEMEDVARRKYEAGMEVFTLTRQVMEGYLEEKGYVLSVSRDAAAFSIIVFLNGLLNTYYNKLAHTVFSEFSELDRLPDDCIRLLKNSFRNSVLPEGDEFKTNQVSEG